MNDLSAIARHWMRQVELGRGIRPEATDLDLLNAVGVGELIAVKAAESQRDQCHKRTMRSMSGGNTGSNGTGEPTEHSEPPISKSPGTTPTPDATEAERQGRRRSAPASEPFCSVHREEKPMANIHGNGPDTDNGPNPDYVVQQPIHSIEIDTIPDVQGSYMVGRNGITRIEACLKRGLHCNIPYIRVWRGDECAAEFCQHNIVGVYYAPA